LIDNDDDFNKRYSQRNTRLAYIDKLIERTNGLIGNDDDTIIRRVYAKFLTHHVPFNDHEIKHFKVGLSNGSLNQKISKCIILVKNDNTEIPIKKKELAGYKKLNAYMRDLVEEQINEYKKKNPCPNDNYEYEVDHKTDFTIIYHDFLKENGINFNERNFLTYDQQKSWKEYHKKIISTDEGALQWLRKGVHKEKTKAQCNKRKLDKESETQGGGKKQK
jgi:hypothetical protein